ncbi:hypothetical protein T11_3548, partial [Trichinella zimbabwensis]
LNQEAFNVPMKQTAVIIAGSAQGKKILNVEGYMWHLKFRCSSRALAYAQKLKNTSDKIVNYIWFNVELFQKINTVEVGDNDLGYNDTRSSDIRTFLSFETSNSDMRRRVLIKSIFCYGVFCPIINNTQM